MSECTEAFRARWACEATRHVGDRDALLCLTASVPLSQMVESPFQAITSWTAAWGASYIGAGSSGANPKTRWYKSSPLARGRSLVNLILQIGYRGSLSACAY